MKKTILPTVICLLVFFPMIVRSAYPDSLFRELKKAKTDTAKVELLDAIGEAFYNVGEADSAVFYTEKTIQLAKEKGMIIREARAKHLMGYILYFLKNDLTAIDYFLFSKKKYEKLGRDYDRFYMHLYLADIYGRRGNIKEAVAHFDSAKIFLNPKNHHHEKDLNFYLGAFYWEQKNLLKAQKYYAENVQIAFESGDSLGYYYALNDMGQIYYELGKPDSAIILLEKSISGLKKWGGQIGGCQIGCLGTNYKAIGDFETALDYFREAIRVLGKKEDAWSCLSYAEMAVCFLKLNRPDSAEFYNKLAIEILPKAEDFKLKRDVFIELVDLYKIRGDYEKAFLNLEKLRMLDDTLFKIENKKVVEELAVKYHTREQNSKLEVQNLQINRQKIMIWAAAGLLMLFGALVFFISRNARIRRRANALLAEKNEQLEALDRTKSRFFTNISHELRTPLTLITAPLERTLEKESPKHLRDDLELAHSNSKKLLTLVNEILDLSKLESGQMELNLTEFDLEETLRRIFFAFESLAKIRNIKLDFESQFSEKIWVKADLPKLEKMVNNLVSNALKYSHPNGTAKLILEPNPFVTIHVSDEGKGIHSDDLPKIFDRFYQSDSDVLVGGTGIGLALTKELAHLFGGELRAKSELGKGSVFSLVLPLIKVKPVSKSTVEMTPFSPPDILPSEDVTSYSPILLDGQKPRILIVEDNPEMSRFLNQTLSQYYECAIAYDGKEALRGLEREHFDLVTSDVMMPEMDGFELLEKVRREGTIFKNIPFILLTARSLEEDKLEGFRLGVDDYVTKPFSTKELLARLHNLLKNKQLRDSLDSETASETDESADRKILKEAEKFVLKNIADSQFGVRQLADSLAVSQRSLVRLINRLTGMSPVGFIREIRMQKAWQYLQRRQFLTVTEVRYEVGIENASYFNRMFKERFGLSPKEVMGKVEL